MKERTKKTQVISKTETVDTVGHLFDRVAHHSARSNDCSQLKLLLSPELSSGVSIDSCLTFVCKELFIILFVSDEGLVTPGGLSGGPGPEPLFHSFCTFFFGNLID